jgi:1,6-anhydro-N-acetylmuramate kinase
MCGCHSAGATLQAEQKKQDSAQLEFRIDERIRVQRASAAESSAAADAEARAAAEALSREHAEEVRLLKSRHYQQDADMVCVGGARGPALVVCFTVNSW